MFLYNIVNNKTTNMNKPKNSHQIFYAKNFYQHTGDIIADMRKVCKLDEPNWDFSSPNQIIKFMRKQFSIWLDNNPSVTKELGSKVAWEDDPIKAEMWSIIISYSVYVPMTMKHIDALPRFDVIPPQYSATETYKDDVSVFSKMMSVEECVDVANKILNRTNLEVLDIIADDAARRFNYNKASKLLHEFGEEVTAQELDDELWDGYSNFIEEHLDENGNLPERDYLMLTDHFVVEMTPLFKPNCSFSFDIHLVPFKVECISDEIVTEENIARIASETRKQCVELLKSNGYIDSIYKVANKLYNDENQHIWEDVPQHLTSIDIESKVKDSVDIDLSMWTRFGYDNKKFFESFQKYTNGDYGMSGNGCFSTYTFNENGHMKTMIAFWTIFECGADDHTLWNGRMIDAPKY